MTKIYSFRTNKIFFQIRAKKETNWKPLPPSSPSFSCPTRPTSPSPFGRPEKPRNTIAITRKNVWSKMGMGEIINGLFTLATFVNETVGGSNMPVTLGGATRNRNNPICVASPKVAKASTIVTVTCRCRQRYRRHYCSKLRQCKHGLNDHKNDPEQFTISVFTRRLDEFWNSHLISFNEIDWIFLDIACIAF